MKRFLPATLLLTIVGTTIGYTQGKFSGYMFGDYFYNIARDQLFSTGNPPNSVVNGQKDLQAFEFRRIYFTYDNDISEHFAARLRLEADQALASPTGDVLSSGKISTFVKDAYLTWKDIFTGSNLTFGIQPTPAYEISESVWGYRSLEKTIMDLRGIIPSRHLGISLRGKLDEGGTFNYWAIFANNSTGSVPNGTSAYSDRFKRYSLLFHVKPGKNLQFTFYGDYLARPSINDPTSTTVPRATLSNSAFTAAAFVGYTEKGSYSLGVEGFLQSIANGYTEPGVIPPTSLNGMGVTFFGSVDVSPLVSLVARYDYFDPNTNSNAKGDSRGYLLGGVAFKPDKNVQIIPNVQLETYASAPNGPSYDASITGRVTFYYIFL